MKPLSKRRFLPVLGLCLAVSQLCLLTGPLLAEEWIDVKDNRGRKLTVLIEKVEDEKVTFSIKSGKSYTYALNKFSVTDQLMLRRWKPPVDSGSPVEDNAKLTQVRASNTETVFRSKHFEFEIVGAATEGQISKFAPLFEAVHWAFTKLPGSLEPKPQESHFKVKLYLSESDFEVATQEKLADDQPAIFNLGNNVLLGPINRIKPSPALTREIAFTLLGEQLNSLPPWLAVAITEYVAAAPFKGDDFDFQDPLDNMLSYLGEQYGQSNKTLPMLSPLSVWELDYGSLRAAGLEGNKSRSSSLLAYYYFAHLDRDGKGMENYLRALRTGSAPDEALNALANDREARQLEDDLKVAYVPKKVRIAFIK